MGDDAQRQLLARRLTAALSVAAGEQAAEPISTPASKAISFAPSLVCAILAGRKTETRRLIRPQPTRAPSIAKCSIAQPGDFLYVREPWAEHQGRIVYAANGEIGISRYRPAMYMPRNASRLTLRVISVRAERLSAITPDAALAEGAPQDSQDPVAWFAALWDGLFLTPGERFVDDPFVWVIAFEPVALPNAT